MRTDEQIEADANHVAKQVLWAILNGYPIAINDISRDAIKLAIEKREQLKIRNDRKFDQTKMGWNGDGG